MVKDTGKADIAQLVRDMEAAAREERFEDAAFLRNEIERLSGGLRVGRPEPGHMGLGTDRPIVARPKGWQPPKKPDPGVSRVKGRRR